MDSRRVQDGRLARRTVDQDDALPQAERVHPLADGLAAPVVRPAAQTRARAATGSAEAASTAAARSWCSDTDSTGPSSASVGSNHAARAGAGLPS
ncbi:hypothetical protein [Streptomyces sp. NPDC088801]|uniref:hypothetical protein n=1 Tax=Streptomyces sp. NPDC088801 TaxID=3365903 RepID=UPI0037FC3964